MNTPPIRRSSRPRGMAMALVLFVVAIAVTTGLCFLSSSVGATPLSQRFANRLRARYIAESGAAQLIAFLQRDATWRITRTPGEWITQQSLAGGWYTIRVDDPVDSNFANSAGDPVRLTVVADYKGARYKAVATYTPPAHGGLSAMTRVEIKSDAKVDSYSPSLGAYGTDNCSAKARLTCNAVGTPNILLQNSAVFAGAMYFPVQGDTSKALKVAATAQITGLIGNLAVEEVPLLDSTEPDYTPSTANVTYDGNDVVTLSSDLACNNLTIKDNAVLKVSGNVTIHCDGDFTMSANAEIRPENPHYGFDSPLSQGQSNVAARQIAARVSVTDTVALRTVAAYTKKKDKLIRFAIYADNAGEPGNLIVQSASEKLTSDSMYWHETYVPATTLAPGTYWVAMCFSDSAQQYQYGAGGEGRVRANNAITNGFLNSWGSSDQTLNHAINLYVTGNVAGKGGALKIYTHRKCDVAGHVDLNVYTAEPKRLTIYHVDESPAATATFAGDTVTYATVVAPAALVNLRERAEFFGIIHTEDLKIEDDTKLHVDTSGGLASPGLLLDLTLLMKDRARIDGISGDAHMVSNAVGTPVIWIRERSVVSGNAFGGPGGAGGNTDVQVAKSAVLTGLRGNLTEAVAIQLTSVPTGLPIVSDFNRDKNITRISSSFQCKKFNIKGTATIEIEGNVVVYATDDVFFNENSTVTLLPGATFTLHTSQPLVMDKNTRVNVGGEPNAFRIYYGGTKLEVKSKAAVCATFTGPNCSFKVKDDAVWYGSVYATFIRAEGRSQIHQEAAVTAGLVWSE